MADACATVWVRRLGALGGVKIGQSVSHRVSDEGVGEDNIELTQGVWDDLPEPVQEGFFKLALLPPMSSLEGVGSADGGRWLTLDSQLTPKKIANKTFSKWYDNLPRA